MSSTTSLAVSKSRSSSSLLSTPNRKPVPTTESPGNWTHPRLAEITRRQNATVFGERNIRAITYNLGAFILLNVLRMAVTKYAPSLLITNNTKFYAGWAYFAVQALPLLNIAISCLPLVRPKDDLGDIPLTPHQRKLLGLPPSSTPATPNSVYSTPPRYLRTPSVSGSVGSNKTNSPGSAKDSPVSGGRINGSTYSQAASPLFQKAVGYNGRRSSFSSSSQMNASTSSFNVSTASSLFPETPGTPSPSTGKRMSVGLNNKWLYDKGRRSSGNVWA